MCESRGCEKSADRDFNLVDPFCSDVLRIWIATDLRCIEVHLGHLAQRRAGWFARRLHSCDVARRG